MFAPESIGVNHVKTGTESIKSNSIYIFISVNRQLLNVEALKGLKNLTIYLTNVDLH